VDKYSAGNVLLLMWTDMYIIIWNYQNISLYLNYGKYIRRFNRI
jgi:hypothetical protein